MARIRSWIGGLRHSFAADAARVLHRRWQARRHVRDLTSVRVNPAPRGAILCFAGVRDEIMRLPDFLRHYRALGVDRFVMVDNGSVDGTDAFLAEQPDVDLFATGASFSRASGGAFWLSGLARGPYAGRWGVMADADELLVYDGCEQHGLRDLARLLEARGGRTLPAMMIDMYPDGPLRDASLTPGRPLVDLCPLFDAEGYEAIGRKAGEPPPRIRKFEGGPRRRLFHTAGRRFYVELGKTPFLRWDRAVTLFDSHSVHPFRLNFAAPTGALLHFKLMSDYAERAEMAIRRLSHADGSRAYRASLPALHSAPAMSAVWSGSRRYRDSGTLVEAGLMSAIDWP